MPDLIRDQTDKIKSDRSSRRILVVDDNVDSAQSMVLLLKLWGFSVEVAYDGPSALAMTAANCPDIVLLDIGMPGMDGYEVARRLRAANTKSDLVLVALSGYAQPEHIERSREAGFTRHLVKPVDFEVLKAFLDEQSGRQKTRVP